VPRLDPEQVDAEWRDIERKAGLIAYEATVTWTGEVSSRGPIDRPLEPQALQILEDMMAPTLS
jgi:hypothetical protein